MTDAGSTISILSTERFQCGGGLCPEFQREKARRRSPRNQRMRCWHPAGRLDESGFVANDFSQEEGGPAVRQEIHLLKRKSPALVVSARQRISNRMDDGS